MDDKVLVLVALRYCAKKPKLDGDELCPSDVATT
jgi:hypothetical protein